MANPVSASWKAWRASCSSKAFALGGVAEHDDGPRRAAAAHSRGDAVMVTGKCDPSRRWKSVSSLVTLRPSAMARRAGSARKSGASGAVDARCPRRRPPLEPPAPAEHAGAGGIHEGDPAVRVDGAHALPVRREDGRRDPLRGRSGLVALLGWLHHRPAPSATRVARSRRLPCAPGAVPPRLAPHPLRRHRRDAGAAPHIAMHPSTERLRWKVTPLKCDFNDFLPVPRSATRVPRAALPALAL